MANHLPLELLYQIAEHLDSTGVPLRPYALVCRAWQLVFESLIYKSLKLHVHSRNFGTGRNGVTRHFSEPIETTTPNDIRSHVKGISLAQFNAITSTPRRRNFVRDITYRIVVPYHIYDYRAKLIPGPVAKYTKNNPIRVVNDKAFKYGVIKLFESLQSWEIAFVSNSSH
ncbi:hypothetical protein BJX66DRAFT_307252 [Aspergillus keveii]|uniref:F-box domain-containing protein n=1 Tax=Aspergillus keveii TaxID=714993 RepID=A0ABR4G126_9EURO